MMFVEKYIKIYSVYECVNEFACVEMINIYVEREWAVCVGGRRGLVGRGSGGVNMCSRFIRSYPGYPG